MSEWAAEVLEQPALRVDDETSVASIAEAYQERLEALLSANMLEPTADGWRNLACALALQYVPAFQIETPVDRGSLGGRPVPDYRQFILRSMMRAEMKKLAAAGVTRGAQGQASKVVGPKLGISPRTANNAMSQGRQIGDKTARRSYEWKAHDAARLAAKRLSSQE